MLYNVNSLSQIQGCSAKDIGGVKLESNKRVIGIIIVLLVVNSIFLIVQTNRVKSLEEQLFQAKYELEQSINNSIYAVTNYIDNAIQSSENLIDNYSISYEGIDLNKKTVTVNIDFRLRESSGTAKINLAASTDSSSEPLNYYEAVSDNGLDYKSRFTVSYLDNYLFDIYLLENNGYQKKMNTHPISLYLKDEFENRTTLSSFGRSVTDKEGSVSFDIINKTFGENDFRLKKVELIVLLEGKEIYRKDVTNMSLADAEAINRHKVAVAAGDISPLGDDFDYEYGKAQMSPDGVEYGYYYIESISLEQITGNEEEANDLSACEFKVEVTYENGEKSNLMS
jgi:hypothetical protein